MSAEVRADAGAPARRADPFAPARLGRSALVALLATALTAAALLVVFRGPGGARAVFTGAGVALAVQGLSFLAARAAPPGRVFAVWVGGAVARMFTLVLYALVAVPLLGLPAAPALLSLAALYFVTTLAESRLHLR